MISAALLVSGPVHAFDAAGVDVIGLQLGMQRAEVIARLQHQGYTARQGATTISADTADGRLRASLSGERGVTEIDYVFDARGAGEPEKILDAVLLRFGPPDQSNPPTWCRAVSADGLCPGDEASLTFLPGSLTLILRGAAELRR